MNLNPVGWPASGLRLVARLFNSGVNSSVPVTAISEAPIGVANADIALVAKGTGATLAQVPDGTTVGGDKRGTNATDFQKVRSSALDVASGSESFIGCGQQNRATGIQTVVAGGLANTATNLRAAICGGMLNNASGQYSGISAGYGNTASSNYSFIGGGQSNVAQTNTHATVCGGNSNTASGANSFIGGGSNSSATAGYAAICGGQANQVSGQFSFVGGGGYNSASSNNYVTVCGGFNNTASGTHSFIGGGYYNSATAQASFIAAGANGTSRGIIGYHVFSACFNPIVDALGRTQSALLLLARQTTDATATVLTSNSGAAGTGNQVILPNNAAYSFSGEVIAGVTGGGDTARWTINGAIKRGANAASTAMVGTPTVTMTHNDAGAAAWTVAVTADTTNGGIAVTVTGAASTTIRWVCKINTTEMTY